MVYDQPRELQNGEFSFVLFLSNENVAENFSLAFGLTAITAGFREEKFSWK
jgi:hypothetical protein